MLYAQFWMAVFRGTGLEDKKVKKKVTFMAFSLLLLFGLILIFVHREYQSFMTAYVISEEEQISLPAQLKNNHDAIPGLLYKGFALPYDSETETYYLPMNAESIEEIENEFTLSDGTEPVYWSEDIYWEILDQAIAQGHRFEFWAFGENGSVNGSIVFTGLPMMVISMDEETRDDQTNCDMILFDPFHSKNGGYEIITSRGIFEERGQTSLRFPKKGYNLELYTEAGRKQDISLLGLREDDDWKLNAFYSDTSKVREKVALELWNEIADEETNRHTQGTRMEYMEVLIDRDYQGLYGLMEPVDYKQLSLDKAQDILFKAVSWPEEGSMDDGWFENRTDYCGQVIKAGDKIITGALWEPMREYIEVSGLNPALERQEAERFNEYRKKHMDTENLLDIELYLQALYAMDNGYKNQYTAVDIQDDGGYLLWRVPWDLNYSFGDFYDGEAENLTGYDLANYSDILEKGMLTELAESHENQEFADALKERWSILRMEILTIEHAKELTWKNVETLEASGALERERIRWPGSVESASVARLLEFYEARLEYLDDYYASY